jgi:ribokinase
VRVAVVGHVEWIEFARVEHVPRPGEIVHASETWQEPGGGGSVAAVQLSKLARESVFFTALGSDGLGHRAARGLQELGVRMQAVHRRTAQRRAFTHLDDRAERTITVMGDRLGPNGSDDLAWELLEATASVYFTAGDRGALQAARRAGVVVATSRILPSLAEAGVQLDAVVGSGKDRDERYEDGLIEPPPRLVVRTAGADGGTYRTSDGRSGIFPAAPPPGPPVDAYGCGDSFAAGLTFALGRGDGVEDALAFAARCGAACLSGRGPYEGQLRLDELA